MEVFHTIVKLISRTTIRQCRLRTLDTNFEQLDRVENQNVWAQVDDGRLDRADPAQQGRGDAQHVHHIDADDRLS